MANRKTTCCGTTVGGRLNWKSFVVVLLLFGLFTIFQAFLWQNRQEPTRGLDQSTRNGASVIGSVQRRKMLFSISSGRSGSHYLAKVLRRASPPDAIYAKSEPLEAFMCCEFVKMINNAPMKDSYQLRKNAKVPVLRDVLSTLPSLDVMYAETNHMFIKTFYDVVMDSFTDADIFVVVLRRYLPEVVKSFVELGFLEDDAPGWSWMHDPRSPTAAISPCVPLDDPRVDVVDRTIAYLIDIEARAQRFRDDYSGYQNLAGVINVRVEALGNKTYVKEIFKQLRLGFNERGWKALLKDDRKNQRTEAKKRAITLAECERRLYVYIGKCLIQNITVPQLPQMHPFVVAATKE